jgi:hypothetical protein
MKLRTIFEIQAIIDIFEIQASRKIPCDIEEFLETERWCKSKEQKMTYGEMDITHYIRSVAKDNTIADRYQKDRIEEMQYTLNQMCEDLETLKKDNE